MRHNQNGRRFRGRNNGQSGGQSHHHHGNSSSGGGGGNRGRVNPRVQTFDSNGPDVRIRGNAYQINEKYIGLAKDAASAGDRVLAESYLQHAEHYQRMINEMTEEYARSQPPGYQQGQGGHQGQGDQHGNNGMVDPAEGEQPVIDGSMPDLDQGFLVGPRRGEGTPPPAENEPAPATVEPRVRRAAKPVDNP